MIAVAPSAAVAGLFFGLAIGSTLCLWLSRYRVYGALAGACARE